MTYQINMTLGKEKNNKKGLYFIKEVAKYFMDFLETDFHKRRTPKRNIVTNNASNLHVGINLGKYSNFNEYVWGKIQKSFSGDLKIKKGQYKTTIPKNLLDLISLNIQKIAQKQINRILSEISDVIENNATLYKKEFNKALNITLESVNGILKKELVLPLISNIEKSLEEMDLGDENTIYLMEEELTVILETLVDDQINNTLKQLISEEPKQNNNVFKNIFTLKEVKYQIENYFSNLKVSDLFSEIYELDRNKSILDKQEFYLYFGDIIFNRARYPIFYIPFYLEKVEDYFVLKFDAQVYINKKALEYIAQEYNKEKNQRGALKSISERIIYLAQEKENFNKLISTVFSELIDFFDLDKPIDILNPNPQVSRSLFVKMSNSCYINLFDKSDEALVNDYELILELLEQENNPLGIVFNKLIEDFIYKDPTTFMSAVDDEWDELEANEKLVYKSPIPLNSEQRQILTAINKEGCNYITVEGPPGTGKSHTITAIAFEYILNNKSVLVLSDKKEALDVVEDKINQTMKRVRIDQSFQNPILRLGKAGNTYSQILSTNTIANIKNHYRAIKNSYSSLEENINKTTNTIKEDLKAETLSYSSININEIKEIINLEPTFDKSILIDKEEIFSNNDASVDFQEIRNIINRIEKIFSDGDENLKPFTDLVCKKDSITKLVNVLNTIGFIIENSSQIKSAYKEAENCIKLFLTFHDDYPKLLSKFLDKYDSKRNKIFGYLFVKKQLEEIDLEFKKNFPSFSMEKPHEQINELKELLEILNYANNLKNPHREIITSVQDITEGDCPHCSEKLCFSDQDRCKRLIKCPECEKDFNLDDVKNNVFEDFKTLKKETIKIDADILGKIDYLNTLFRSLNGELTEEFLQKIISLRDDASFLINCFDKYPKSFQKLKIDNQSLFSVWESSLFKSSENDFNEFLRYITLKQKVTEDFKRVPEANFFQQKNDLERLVTAQMTYLMDKRVVDFYENSLGTARTLREIIKEKRQFPKEEFKKLKHSFPCILSGIRDYAEYIPLNPEMFDLVIIDEASQVSIAQAFPALLRAKKVLILGDKKQFSNVKSAQAKTDTNRLYLSRLKKSFLTNISKNQSQIKRLEKFNIKTSILEFFEFINNFNIQLTKHFRGYPELISYSDHFFYKDSLQVMKVRGKPIDQVLKFTELPSDGKEELIQNTNPREIDEIIKHLKLLVNGNEKVNVGIITPHTNQQKLFVEKISQLEERDKIFNDLNLKIMTFDTCQGEERDIIFYSMVATTIMDRLWGVFIKDLSKIDLEENGQIKAQRLNVGFSRAKEQIHFVYSKPIEKFNGAIGDALTHYKNTLNLAKKEPSLNQVDSNSPMEKKLLMWLMQTKFYKENKEAIEIKTQFPLGKYLQQLDMTYQHPNYVVDFLITFLNKNGGYQKIIVEYDGFEYHFKDKENVNEFTYEYYYNDDDIYRQKVLEGYGYKFLRINRFNLGEDKIKALDEKLNVIFRENHFSTSQSFFQNLNHTVSGLQNGEMKECPNCKQIKENSFFKDSSLISGFGRICLECKGISNNQQRAYTMPTQSKICPKCGSSMILRNGRYGKFYGCSRFPYCRSTQKYIT